MRTIPFLLILFLMVACEEIPPVVRPITNVGDCPLADAAAVAGQNRQVLIEEFTGVQCVNCPAGSDFIEELIGQHGGQLLAVSIHEGFFARPFSASLYDFRTEDGKQLLNLLREPFGYPSAVINRRLFDGEGDLQLGRGLWAGYIQQELQQPPKVKMAIRRSFEPVSRFLTVEVSLFVEEAINEEDVRLTVLLTEDGIIDLQKTPDGNQPDYVHRHVLRDVLTNADGNPLQEEWTPGNQFCKKYESILPAEWKTENGKIIAFVHLGGERKDVLQAVQANVN